MRMIRGDRQTDPVEPTTYSSSVSAPDSGGHTRQLLLEILKRCGECDVSGLAEKLGISGVAVRQHLSSLERAGLLMHRQERRPVGRPVRLYRLTNTAERHFPQSSDRVALDLLARVEKMMGVEAIESALDKRIEDLASLYAERLKGARSWSQKLELLASIRDSEGYLCNVEPVAAAEARGGVRLVHHHCPLSAIADQFPQLCAYELELFRRVLGEPDIRRVDHIHAGGHTCSYELPKKKTPKREAESAG